MSVLRLYPGTREEQSLDGLYLGDLPSGGKQPFVYANFLSSLDGRIAVRDAAGHTGVPETIANPRDWRLYSELLVQADAVLTTSHHAKAIARGESRDMMTILHERYPDLRNYRRARGLSGHPVCVVVGSHSDLPARALKAAHPGAIVAVGPQTDEGRPQTTYDAGIETITAGIESKVTGRDLLHIFRERGLKRIYMIGGPRLFHSLLADKVVNRLYLTTASRILGGEDIETLVRGPQFAVPGHARLRHLTLDPEGPPPQMFACYDINSD